MRGRNACGALADVKMFLGDVKMFLGDGLLVARLTTDRLPKNEIM